MLLRLNTAQEYAEQLPANLAVAPILEELSRHPSGHTVLAILCVNPVFAVEQARNECLLSILPKIHPLFPQALTFLRNNVTPESDSLEVAIRVLFDIGEKSTLALFADQVVDGDHDPILIVSWLRDPLLRHRREPAVLQMCLDLLQKNNFPPELKNALVEAMFDYRPAEWYVSEGPVQTPPKAESSSAEIVSLLVKINHVVAKDGTISTENKALAARSVSRR